MFNSTISNWSSTEGPHFEAHKNYIVGTDEVDCRYVMKLDWNEMCAFTRVMEKCSEMAAYFDYMDFMFCQINLNQTKFLTMIIVYSTLLCALILGLIVASYVRFAPCFLAVAHYLKFDEHTAGTVLLVLLVYTSDTIENCYLFEYDTLTAFSECLGTAIVLTGFYNGLLATSYPFVLHPPYFLRDSIFLISGLMFGMYVYIHMDIYIYHAFGFMAFYIVYLVYILIEFIIIQAGYRRKYNTSKDKGLNFTEDDMKPEHQPIKIKFEINNSLQYGELDGPNVFLIRQFWSTLNPLRMEIIGPMSVLYKCVFILGMPMHLLLILLIPVLDYRLPNHGWSKLMTCVNLVLAGPFLTAVFTFKWKYFLFTWIPGVICAVIVFFTTRTDRQPRFQIIFAFFGLLMCVAVSFAFESEVVSISHSFGIFMGLTRSTIGLGLLAFADTIGVVVLARTLAHWGYYRMAYSSFWVGPLYNSVYGLGLLYTMRLWKSGEKKEEPRIGAMSPTSAVFVAFLIAYIFVAIVLSNFQVRKSVGISTVVICLAYYFNAILVEFEVIHGMGTDHSQTSDLGVQWA